MPRCRGAEVRGAEVRGGLPGRSSSGRRESNSRSQLGKVPEPNLGELMRIITAGQRVIHTATDERERRRPRDIRGMRAITKPSNYEVPQRVLWHGGLAPVTPHVRRPEGHTAGPVRCHPWSGGGSARIAHHHGIICTVSTAGIRRDARVSVRDEDDTSNERTALADGVPRHVYPITSGRVRQGRRWRDLTS